MSYKSSQHIYHNCKKRVHMHKEGNVSTSYEIARK